MTDPVDDGAWTAAALARPGIAVYPEMLRRSRPPAQPAVAVAVDGDAMAFGQSGAAAPSAPLPAPRRRWWHRLVHALARSDD